MCVCVCQKLPISCDCFMELCPNARPFLLSSSIAEVVVALFTIVGATNNAVTPAPANMLKRGEGVPFSPQFTEKSTLQRVLVAICPISHQASAFGRKKRFAKCSCRSGSQFMP